MKNEVDSREAVAEPTPKQDEVILTGEEESSDKPKPKLKRKKYLTKTQKLQKELDDLKDKHLRYTAEFENYKKRRARDTESLIRSAERSKLLAFLPLLDDLDRSLHHARDHDDVDSIAEGLELIVNKFNEILDTLDVKKIEPVGKPFDPDFHDAMMVKQDSGEEPNIVVEEFETGYLYKGRTLRPSKVGVSG